MQPYRFADSFAKNSVQPSAEATYGCYALAGSFGNFLRRLCAFGDGISGHSLLS
jgi:hypothetical protein